MNTGDTIFVVVSDHHSCGVQILGLYELREDAVERALKEVEGEEAFQVDDPRPGIKSRWTYGSEDSVWIEEWDWQWVRKGRRVAS